MRDDAHKAVVIGGGIIGLCSAWQLLERGVETVVIDSAPEGGDNGARQYAGMIVPSHFIPLAALAKPPPTPHHIRPQLWRRANVSLVASPLDDSSCVFCLGTSRSRMET